MSPIVWLASYPKSGSTWFRALLANLSRSASAPAPLDALGAPLASSRTWFDWATGLDASDLTHAEAAALRPEVYAQAARTTSEATPLFLKIHDAFRVPGTDDPVVAPEVTRGAIYLVRNPLDVCVSYAHHSSWSPDRSAETLGDPTHALCAHEDRLANQLRQHLSSWSGHVASWLDNGTVPVHVVRYEDLTHSPVETLADAITFAGLERDREEIVRAIEWSRFDRLRALEDATGFGEKPAGLERFFRRGVVGGWRDELAQAQVQRILTDHGGMMQRLGYPVVP